MTEFDELRLIADNTRSFIQNSQDRARALRAVVYSHDVVLGIFPDSKGVGLHVIKGDLIFREIAQRGTAINYNHTAIAFSNREQAIALQKLLKLILPLQG